MLIIKLFTQNNVTTKIYSTSNLEISMYFDLKKVEQKFGDNAHKGMFGTL